MDAVTPPTVRGLLEFEAAWVGRTFGRQTAIRDTFGLTATRYYQLLNAAIDTIEALEIDPVQVHRLQRLRESRLAARNARIGIQH